jgi:hypothetical protein
MKEGYGEIFLANGDSYKVEKWSKRREWNI